MKPWQTAALIGFGLSVGAIWPERWTDAFRAGTLYIFLPALIFEAAWNLDAREMLRAWRPIVLLILPGVVLTALLVALGAHYFGGLVFPVALLLGAILSATDPVAVVAIFRRLRVPRALATIVESEALLNDAIAFVLYRAVVISITLGVSFQETGTIALHALLGSIFAISLGIVAGVVFGQILRMRNNVVAQSIATFAAAYTVYFAADKFGWSGIFAVIACAMTMREYDRRDAALATAEGVERIWDRAAFIANVLLFFLIGAAVEPLHLVAQWRPIAATLLGVGIARVVLAYGLLAFVPRMQRSWKLIVQLAGVRGALALVLALATPRVLPQSEAIVDVTFAVVLITIVAGAFTIEGRIKALSPN